MGFKMPLALFESAKRKRGNASEGNCTQKVSGIY